MSSCSACAGNNVDHDCELGGKFYLRLTTADENPVWNEYPTRRDALDAVEAMCNTAAVVCRTGLDTWEIDHVIVKEFSHAEKLGAED